MKTKLNLTKTLGILIAIITFSNLSIAQNQVNDSLEWKLVKTNKKGLGWEVYKAKTPSSKLNQFKITGIMNCSPQKGQSTVMEMIIDPDLRITKKGKSLGWVIVLKRTDNEMEVYDYMKGSGIVKDRDVVVRYRLFRDTSSNIMGVKWRQIDKEGYEVRDTIIRMPVAKGSWKFEAIDSTSCVATCSYQFHPGGTLPTWMINMVSKAMIPIEFEYLREAVKK